MKRKHDLPIILSHNTHTGIMIFPNRKMGGRDMCIVRLNNEIQSGGNFEMSDIAWVKAVLHFGDLASIEITADILAKAAKAWKKEGQDE